MKRRLIFSLVALVLALNLVCGARIYFSSAHAADEKDSPDANLERFADVLEKVKSSYVDGSNMTYHALTYSALLAKIRTQYVDGTNLTYRQLTYAALNGMVAKLDPHSEFLDPDDYQQLQDDTEGQFGGLGLVVAMRDGFVTVVSPMDDTPGYRAGILSGDRIVKVEDQSVDKMPLTDVF